MFFLASGMFSRSLYLNSEIRGVCQGHPGRQSNLKKLRTSHTTSIFIFESSGEFRPHLGILVHHHRDFVKLVLLYSGLHSPANSFPSPGTSVRLPFGIPQASGLSESKLSGENFASMSHANKVLQVESIFDFVVK